MNSIFTTVTVYTNLRVYIYTFYMFFKYPMNICIRMCRIVKAVSNLLSTMHHTRDCLGCVSSLSEDLYFIDLLGIKVDLTPGDARTLNLIAK